MQGGRMGDKDYTQHEIMTTIEQYQANILNDINLIVRLTYENKLDGTSHTYHTRLVTLEGDKIIFNSPTEQLDWVQWKIGRASCRERVYGLV